MKKTATLVACLSLAGCLGFSSTDNELTGQVKRCQHIKPIIFSDYTRCDISLGVMRNGVGSMSKEDVWVYVPLERDYALLESAAKTGALVNVQYDVARFRWYVEDDMVTSARLAE